MSNVRFGIVGMGNMGRYHADALLAGRVARAELAAVCSTSPGKLQKYQPLPIFDDVTKLIESRAVVALLIATPHPQHPAQAIAAFEAGLHVMVEKPIASHKADAERLIAAAARHPRQVFGAMFQLRTEPRYAKLRKLIQEGELGPIVRINWIITDWYRTEAYYASGGWRATWKGEGGGVLLNQCLHQLDTLQWLVGMPARIRGFCQLGRYHDIDVEDNVTIYLEWADGATGVFVSSTGESPGTNRFEICGTRGRVVLENQRLTFTRNDADMIEFSRKAATGFAKPDLWHVEIPFENAKEPHSILLQNFTDAILDGGPLLVPGAEGIHSVELANAMLYSSLQAETVELPLDAGAFEGKLEELIAGSKREKKVVAIAGEDFTKSFHR
ncbi:MAG TPA: Gfo/Idh/MocA family oxidoreductase [Candidatus Saccharimonadales bacterium]|nr:Gfo/Idh/MocA family oxidoreductase [Candidatus Saccharimonadales bacterium]